ncbi:MAG TPA: hypothetical protein VGZ69_07675 [Candidatus Rhabdochlamydia sp.]|nr:hypothetical protein [Candidatus Rhabdochlamydia sp.]
MASYLSKALIVSLPLSYLGFSFSTAFPICLALIVFTSFMSFALDSIKEAIHALAQKSKACLTRIAQVINDIFEKICAFISSFALQAIHLKALSFTFDKKLPINYAVITDIEAFTEETSPYFAAHLPIPHQAFVALEKRSTDLVSIEEISQIQEDTQIVTLAVPQKETPELEKKAKKSEILFKFDQLCAVSGFVTASNYPSSSQFQNPYKLPLQLATPPISTPRITLPKPTGNQSPEIQKLMMVPTPPNPSLVKFGMKSLHLVKKIIK